ncbi:hypothetical protein ACTOB_004541 [Actinoplanes oblitus]|uniref:Uncharacterized protein n=1 Tax=Actinoplanes oblitus TaxID=3040509 RepID=A0ABY8W848_9ACTN|nr:hypothetical protein [Actinoplanes oblitus]WIM92593.1 hypothetical protein ACTOB_004541 [Actinoplanes oblitus]
MMKIDGRDPEAPTESSAIHDLADQVGREMAEELWRMAARHLGIARPVRKTSDLRRIAEHLMTVTELARVASRSLKIRVITYDALTKELATCLPPAPSLTSPAGLTRSLSSDSTASNPAPG